MISFCTFDDTLNHPVSVVLFTTGVRALPYSFSLDGMLFAVTMYTFWIPARGLSPV